MGPGESRLDEPMGTKLRALYQRRNCLARFNANPERYLARLTSSVSDPDEQPAQEAHEAAEHRRDASLHEHNAEAASGAGQPEEDRGSAHDQGGGRPPLLARVHPIIVHFPVAGIPLALLGFLAWLVSRRQGLAAANVPPLLLVALASIAAVITGNIAHDTTRFGAALYGYIRWHQYAGTTVMILVLVLSVLRIWRWNRLTGRWPWVYGSGLLLASLVVALTGYLGGSLVFGPEHLAW